MRYRTFEEQYRHYFDRPGGSNPTGRVGGLAAWTASELEADTAWIVEVTPNEIDSLDAALDSVAASGVPLRDLQRSDVDLGDLAASVRSWATSLSDGRGIVLVRGFPVARWGEDKTGLATWCLGLHLGFPGAQNPQGDLLGNVRDDGPGAVDEHTRLYRTDAAIRFHCDYADVVGLMCLRQAPVGGASRVASSTAIHDELWRSSPAAARRLYRSVWLDARDEGPVPAIEVTPFVFDGERVRTFYHSDYFRSAARHGGRFDPSAELLTALDHVDELAASDRFCCSMRLEPGDLQLLSNHSVVHARSAYCDDPSAPRHLLRLWLSTDRGRDPHHPNQPTTGDSE